LLASLWSALWAGLLVIFFWHFRFESLGFANNDPAFDAMMQLPVTEGIGITRLAAMYLLIPIAGMIVAGSLVITETLLFLFHLDRDKLWFDAVKWSLSGWKALLAWLSANAAIYMLPFLMEQEYAIWVSITLGLSLILMLPFVVLNKDYVTATNPKGFAMPQWPGAQPVLLMAVVVAVAAPLLVYFDSFSQVQLNPWLVFLIDRLQDLIFAIFALLLSSFWINRRMQFNVVGKINLKNTGGFLSLNIMTGLWTTIVVGPPLFCLVITNFFLLPSILLANKENFEIYSKLSDASQAIGLLSVYWWIVLAPLICWMLIHAYGRLVFLLGLVEEKRVAGH